MSNIWSTKLFTIFDFLFSGFVYFLGVFCHCDVSSNLLVTDWLNDWAQHSLTSLIDFSFHQIIYLNSQVHWWTSILDVHTIGHVTLGQNSVHFLSSCEFYALYFIWRLIKRVWSFDGFEMYMWDWNWPTSNERAWKGRGLFLVIRVYVKTWPLTFYWRAADETQKFYFLLFWSESRFVFNIW